ncbi:AzlD family protein [Cognatishimia sp. WU-CL00825]|uniref:AzlD family protein n=1 Tax=Cognatishimia sp. WU-CL00825 TaxID=3127658 RepID=UPI003106F3E8
MPDSFVLILLCALVTYATRCAGFVIMSYFGTVHARVAAGLEAVPIAVLSALVAPFVVQGALYDALALVLVCLLSLRLPMLPSVTLGVVTLAVLRAVS